MLDCFRTGGANSPETFVTAVAATLARYPDQVIYSVTDPETGLPSQLTFMPTIKDVRDACELASLPMRNRIESEKRVAEQLEARRQADESNASKPTYEELQAKYGRDWGIQNPDRARKEPTPAPTWEQIAHHYKHYDLDFKPKREVRDVEA